MINVKDVVTLDDNKEYCVASKTIFEYNTYYFLVDLNDTKNIKICRESIENNSLILTEVEDTNLIQKLFFAFNESNKNN